METNFISPKYLMNIIQQIEKVLFNEFNSYKRVENYMRQWGVYEYGWNNYVESGNFDIFYKDQENTQIDITKTLSKINDKELILKIAIDLGIDTPDFIPSIPVFKNELKNSFESSFNNFEKALKQVNENPDLAVGLANTTLESIIKEILKDSRVSTKLDKNKTLYDLTQDILKEFSFFPKKQSIEEIRNIGSSLLNLCKNIESFRSNKTYFHGKTKDDYIIDSSIYAFFVVNSISTVGLFLISFYNKKFKIENFSEENYEEIKLDELPF